MEFALYVFLIIVGCVVFVLLGFGIWTMYHGIEDNSLPDMSREQKSYMRQLRQRNLNVMAVQARRPDLIIPIDDE
ncbi:hypothetical protein N7474_005131 [Penicillium riverlandense]|uniref:uncharacterized protein n=1 Tax=Penicillium riverlandense TaxID=1903569 RepID=UPI0025478311|nr:uncharacterized protein N7474_005131 [Penicillium riverlandense]KAJ5819540.1 hypothetical protein N7474_005131 [Penicillium riverlandense]